MARLTTLVCDVCGKETTTQFPAFNNSHYWIDVRSADVVHGRPIDLCEGCHGWAVVELVTVLRKARKAAP